MAQFLRPIADITTTGITGSYTDIDEVTASDADFIYGADGGGNVYECLLSTPASTPKAGSYTLRFRRREIDGGVPSGGTNGPASPLTIEMYQGATQLWTTTIALTGSWASVNFGPTLSGVTDWSDVRVRVSDNSHGGNPNSRRAMGISWIELEVPDGAVTTPLTINRTATPTGSANASLQFNKVLSRTASAVGALVRVIAKTIGLAGGTGASADWQMGAETTTKTLSGLVNAPNDPDIWSLLSSNGTVGANVTGGVYAVTVATTANMTLVVGNDTPEGAFIGEIDIDLQATISGSTNGSAKVIVWNATQGVQQQDVTGFVTSISSPLTVSTTVTATNPTDRLELRLQFNGDLSNTTNYDFDYITLSSPGSGAEIVSPSASAVLEEDPEQISTVATTPTTSIDSGLSFLRTVASTLSPQAVMARIASLSRTVSSPITPIAQRVLDSARVLLSSITPAPEALQAGEVSQAVDGQAQVSTSILRDMTATFTRAVSATGAYLVQQSLNWLAAGVTVLTGDVSKGVATSRDSTAHGLSDFTVTAGREISADSVTQSTVISGLGKVTDALATPLATLATEFQQGVQNFNHTVDGLSQAAAEVLRQSSFGLVLSVATLPVSALARLIQFGINGVAQGTATLLAILVFLLTRATSSSPVGSSLASLAARQVVAGQLTAVADTARAVGRTLVALSSGGASLSRAMAKLAQSDVVALGVTTFIAATAAIVSGAVQAASSVLTAPAKLVQAAGQAASSLMRASTTVLDSVAQTQAYRAAAISATRSVQSALAAESFSNNASLKLIAALGAASPTVDRLSVRNLDLVASVVVASTLAKGVSATVGFAINCTASVLRAFGLSRLAQSLTSSSTATAFQDGSFVNRIVFWVLS